MNLIEVNVSVKSNKWQIFQVKPYYAKKNGKVNSIMLFLNNPGEHEYIKKMFLNLEQVDAIFGKVNYENLNADLVGSWLEVEESVKSVQEE